MGIQKNSLSIICSSVFLKSLLRLFFIESKLLKHPTILSGARRRGLPFNRISIVKALSGKIYHLSGDGHGRFLNLRQKSVKHLD